MIDTKDSPFGDVGVVAVVPIGMAQVSSVNMIYKEGALANKGDEFGFFMFGASDIIVLFEEKAQATLVQREGYGLVGQSIARLQLQDK